MSLNLIGRVEFGEFDCCLYRNLYSMSIMEWHGTLWESSLCFCLALEGCWIFVSLVCSLHILYLP